MQYQNEDGLYSIPLLHDRHVQDYRAHTAYRLEDGSYDIPFRFDAHVLAYQAHRALTDHCAHVRQYRDHIKGLIVENYQKIQADKAMEKFCVAHVEAFKRYQKRLWQINQRQDAHVRAYQNHLKRSRAANDSTIAPVGADAALIAA